MRIQKFLFSHSFDERDFSNLGPVVPELRVSLEEMNRAVDFARDRGYLHGLEEGLAQGQAKALETIEKETEKILHKVLSELSELLVESQKRSKFVLSEVVVIVRQVIQKIFPLCEKNFAPSQVRALIASLLEKEKPPLLKVYLHPMVYQNLKDNEDLSGVPLLFIEDCQYPISYCKVEWQESGVEWVAEQVWQGIESILKGFENVLIEDMSIVDDSEGGVL